MTDDSNWLEVLEGNYRLSFFGKNIQRQFENVVYFIDKASRKAVVEIDQDKKQISLLKTNVFRNDHQDELVKVLINHSDSWEELGLSNCDDKLQITSIESNKYFTVFNF